MKNFEIKKWSQDSAENNRRYVKKIKHMYNRNSCKRKPINGKEMLKIIIQEKLP